MHVHSTEKTTLHKFVLQFSFKFSMVICVYSLSDLLGEQLIMQLAPGLILVPNLQMWRRSEGKLIVHNVVTSQNKCIYLGYGSTSPEKTVTIKQYW